MKTVYGCRWSSTLLSGGPDCDASMEFDIVGFQSWNGRTRKKFADQAKRRKSWPQLSLCENGLTNWKYGIAVNNYDRSRTVG